ncbi:MAG: NAD(P)/FAD-dependent oxidoreductase [Euryarchaeota archaeon]|nr:NAD(P)/FAD-dependent oxidoreductase [Euryarchaeota archaeon]
MVVGAGPAGASAAAAAAGKGLKTLLIEKWEKAPQEVFDVAIGAYLMPFLPFRIPQELLTWDIDRLVFRCGRISIERAGGAWKSYAVDRERFDSWLRERAVEEGAELRLGTEVLDLELRGGMVAGVRVTGGDVLRPGVLIAADGTDSAVRRKAGLNRQDPIIGQGIGYELEGAELLYPHGDQFFFGSFAPGGYGHLFPLGENRAGVGVGSILTGDIESCLEGFLELPGVREQVGGARVVKRKRAPVPFDRLSEGIQYGNLLLAGDAASQNIKPLMEGYLPSIICGDIAGKSAAEAILEGREMRYEERVRKRLGLLFDESDKYVGLIKELTGVREEVQYLLLMGLCANVISPGEALELKGRGAEAVRMRLEEWKGSRYQQVRSRMLEALGLIYFRLSSML